MATKPRRPETIEAALATARRLIDPERVTLANAAREAIQHAKAAEALGLAAREPTPKAVAAMLRGVADAARAAAAAEQRLAERLWKLKPPEDRAARALLSALSWSEQKRGIPRDLIDTAQRIVMHEGWPDRPSVRVSALRLLADESERLASEAARRKPIRTGARAVLARWIVRELATAWESVTRRPPERSRPFTRFAVATCREAGEPVSENVIRSALRVDKQP